MNALAGVEQAYSRGEADPTPYPAHLSCESSKTSEPHDRRALPFGGSTGTLCVVRAPLLRSVRVKGFIAILGAC